MINGGSVYAKTMGDVTNVKAIIRYNADGGDGYVTAIECRHNGRKVLGMNLTEKTTREPYLEFRFRGGAKGDEMELSWRDNKGATGSAKGNIL
jgi:sulfur-oxidizing protein SoxZ